MGSDGNAVQTDGHDHSGGRDRAAEEVGSTRIDDVAGEPGGAPASACLRSPFPL
jgi:hypothetical protein